MTGHGQGQGHGHGRTPNLEVAAARARRRAVGVASAVLFRTAAWAGVLILGALLVEVGRQGLGRLDWQFLTSFPSRFPDQAGIKAALGGTLWVITLTAAVAVPLGVGAAIYLEEYSRRGRIDTWIEINIANLAGVPAIVYGILGLGLFVRGLALGRSVLSGALTLALLILPSIVMASREALRAVPPSMRQAAFALGATRWQAIRSHVLPAAMPGILTGVILAVSRAIGEAAPLIMIGALTYIAFLPTGPGDAFTTLPIQIFNWASRPKPAFHELAAAAILVLLVVLLSLNAAAILIRDRFQRKRP